jgi:hypothetical protein
VVAPATAPLAASVKAANLRTPSGTAARDRFADGSSQVPAAAQARGAVSSDAGGSLSACEPRAAA